MSSLGDYPVYYKQPFRWLSYHAHTRPYVFYATAIAALGPVFIFVVTPVRRKFLYEDHVPLPVNGYPIPRRARDKNLKGYDD
ncbi:hypothetical protein PACTADRAFT_716 [Pachysolen tannophilus NRRL Y-2460]|uniref:NADH-ubiquinone oxidoreductase 9.5 kDa subunit n=1 Tax=Pachysolen tannophilus NRRL Y-2460 TaxID=669874 RepID=A0A1E4U2K5_PACTA|nr:hypothetical protein PACTADRAFT_716 [Pachysolen tannophilus NRRL Y-2460]